VSDSARFVGGVMGDLGSSLTLVLLDRSTIGFLACTRWTLPAATAEE
jgi:hypothetical protein